MVPDLDEILAPQTASGQSETQMKQKRLITAALPYINNIPHLGHIVGSHLPADIFARYCRLKGFETIFVGGSDENGTPSEIAAQKIGVPIKIFLDRIHQEHKKIYEWFNISYDKFSRTSTPLHDKTVQEFFQKVFANGFISEGKLTSFYCNKDDRFLADRYVEGTCAKCGYTHANGDQCEKCTTFLDAKELQNPHCKICGTTPELRESKHLFLQLDKLSEPLETWLKDQKEWRPQVTKLALGWINEGLRERCITRDLKHGVKVPIPGYEDKVFYVWFDAPIGYITITKEASPQHWQDFWKNKDSKIYHFLGKDNIPFHTIFWPGMLLANGEFNLPHHVEGLQYLNYEGDKFSKSKKWGVFCEKLPSSGIDPDVFRAYLTFLIPETTDTDFKWKDFQTKLNNEIIATYGNFVNRTLSFVYNKLDKTVERPTDSELTDKDKEFVASIEKRVASIDQALEHVQLRTAFSEIIALAAEGNRYFDYCAPWKSVKTDVERTRKVLYLCSNLCRTLAVVTAPYLPTTAERIWNQLNLQGKPDEVGNFTSAGNLSLPAKHTINQPHILFNKIQDADLEEIKNKVAGTVELEDYFR